MIESGKGGAQPNLSANDILKYEISLPSLPEQLAIAGVLSDMEGELGVLRARRGKVGLVKAGMMGALLGGRVRLVDKENANEL